VGSVLEADPKSHTAGSMMPGGQGKSTLLAAPAGERAARAPIVTFGLAFMASSSYGIHN
jgi:ABC-type cobalamin transport system ATPase subunit